MLAAAASLFGNDAAPPDVTSLAAGRFRLHVQSRPFRFALHDGARPIIAERARFASSIEVRDNAGWRALGDAIRVETSVAPDGAAACAASVACEGRGPVAVELRLEPDGSLSFTCIPSRDGSLEWRDDFVTYEKETVVALPRGADNRHSRRVVLSSRGHGLFAAASPGDSKDGTGPRVSVLAPDPDALRVEGGPHMRLLFVPGTPAEALARIERALPRRATAGGEGPEELPVRRWEDLRSGMSRVLERSLSRALEDTGRVVLLPSEGAELSELRRRTLEAAVFAGALHPGLAARDPEARAVIECGRALEGTFAGAAQAGRPSVRPLLLAYPDDERAWKVFDEWLLPAEDILVAPVLDPAKTEREVYFPRGTWVDLRSPLSAPRTHAGPGKAMVSSRPGEPPVFAPEGLDTPLVRQLRAVLARTSR